MKRTEAEILLKKFFDAETTLEEEQMLREYFQKGNTDSDLIPYKEFFTGIGKMQRLQPDGKLEEQIMDYILEKESEGKNRFRYLWLTISGVAASLLLAVGGMLYYHQQQPFRDTFSDPEIAMVYAEQTLQFVSSRYNKGLAQLDPVKRLSDPVRHLENGLRLANKGFNPVPMLSLKDDELHPSVTKK